MKRILNWLAPRTLHSVETITLVIAVTCFNLLGIFGRGSAFGNACDTIGDLGGIYLWMCLMLNFMRLSWRARTSDRYCMEVQQSLAREIVDLPEDEAMRERALRRELFERWHKHLDTP